MKIHQTVRDDGMRIITCKTVSKKAHMRIISGAGSAYDPSDQEGLFHFFEHMGFKGTEHQTLQDIQRFVARYLLYTNACTRQTHVEYEGTTVAHRLSDLCEWLSDIYFNSTYPAEELEIEKGVVLNEIAASNGQDAGRASRALSHALWRHNPLRRDPIGLEDHIRQITREDLLQAHQRWHTPSATVIIAVGGVQHDQFVRHINTLVPQRLTDVSYRTWDAELEDIPHERTITLTAVQPEQGVVVYGCKYPVSTDLRTDVANIFLSEMLTSPLNSILWNEVREKRGLAYQVAGGINNQYPLASYFHAYARTFPSATREVLGIFRECCGEPLRDSEMFEATQQRLCDWWTVGFEAPDHWAYPILVQMVWRGLSPGQCERYFRSLHRHTSRITLEEVEAYRALLRPDHFVAVTVQS